MKIKVASLCLVVAALLLSLGLSIHSYNSDEFSSDSAKLGQIVKIPFLYRSVKWETFGIPETRADEVPGPTDYIVLIAVLDADPIDTSSMDNADLKDLFRSSIRNWLPADLKATLTTSLEIGKWPSRDTCKKYEGIKYLSSVAQEPSPNGGHSDSEGTTTIICQRKGYVFLQIAQRIGL